MIFYKKKVYSSYILLLAGTLISFPISASVCMSIFDPVIYAYSSLVEDFNNDGIDDEYVIKDEYSTVSLSRNGNEFDFVYQIHEAWAINDSMVQSNYGIPTEVIGVDLNNDGYKDIVAAFGSRIVARINDGQGNFSSDVQQTLNLVDLYGVDEVGLPEAKSEYNSKLVSLDVNKDGYSDLVILHYDGLSIFLNDTQGQLNHQSNLAISGIPEKDIDSVFVLDVDMDSNDEIIVSTSGSYVIFLNTEQTGNIVSIANQSDKIEPMDYDGDGDIDFAEENSYDFCQTPTQPDYRRYWINNGPEGFSEKIVPNGGDFSIDPIVIDQPEDKELAISAESSSEEKQAASISYVFIILLLFVKQVGRISESVIRRTFLYRVSQ